MQKITISALPLVLIISLFGGIGVSHASSPLPEAPILYMFPYKLNMTNPGYEADFNSWNREPNQFRYGSAAKIDNNESHSGAKSAKLYLRWGGSEVDRDIDVNIPAGASASLSFWMKMPFAGSRGNKWFVGQINAYAVDGHLISTSWIDQFDPLPAWTQKQVNFKPDEDVARLNIKVHTQNGNGAYLGFDRLVWVDDFEVSVQCPIGAQSSYCINSLAGLIPPTEA